MKRITIKDLQIEIEGNAKAIKANADALSSMKTLFFGQKADEGYISDIIKMKVNFKYLIAGLFANASLLVTILIVLVRVLNKSG